MELRGKLFNLLIQFCGLQLDISNSNSSSSSNNNNSSSKGIKNDFNGFKYNLIKFLNNNKINYNEKSFKKKIISLQFVSMQTISLLLYGSSFDKKLLNINNQLFKWIFLALNNKDQGKQQIAYQMLNNILFENSISLLQIFFKKSISPNLIESNGFVCSLIKLINEKIIEIPLEILINWILFHLGSNNKNIRTQIWSIFQLYINHIFNNQEDLNLKIQLPLTEINTKIFQFQIKLSRLISKNISIENAEKFFEEFKNRFWLLNNSFKNYLNIDFKNKLNINIKNNIIKLQEMMLNYIIPWFQVIIINKSKKSDNDNDDDDDDDDDEGDNAEINEKNFYNILNFLIQITNIELKLSKEIIIKCWVNLLNIKNKNKKNNDIINLILKYLIQINIGVIDLEIFKTTKRIINILVNLDYQKHIFNYLIDLNLLTNYKKFKNSIKFIDTKDVSMVLLTELVTILKVQFTKHLPRVLYLILLTLDHPNAFILLHSKQLLLNLIIELILTKRDLNNNIQQLSLMLVNKIINLKKKESLWDFEQISYPFSNSYIHYQNNNNNRNSNNNSRKRNNDHLKNNNNKSQNNGMYIINSENILTNYLIQIIKIFSLINNNIKFDLLMESNNWLIIKNKKIVNIYQAHCLSRTYQIYRIILKNFLLKKKLLIEPIILNLQTITKLKSSKNFNDVGYMSNNRLSGDDDDDGDGDGDDKYQYLIFEIIKTLNLIINKIKSLKNYPLIFWVCIALLKTKNENIFYSVVFLINKIIDKFQFANDDELIEILLKCQPAPMKKYFIGIQPLIRKGFFFPNFNPILIILLSKLININSKELIGNQQSLIIDDLILFTPYFSKFLNKKFFEINQQAFSILTKLYNLTKLLKLRNISIVLKKFSKSVYKIPTDFLKAFSENLFKLLNLEQKQDLFDFLFKLIFDGTECFQFEFMLLFEYLFLKTNFILINKNFKITKKKINKLLNCYDKSSNNFNQISLFFEYYLKKIRTNPKTFKPKFNKMLNLISNNTINNNKKNHVVNKNRNNNKMKERERKSKRKWRKHPNSISLFKGLNNFPKIIKNDRDSKIKLNILQNEKQNLDQENEKIDDDHNHEHSNTETKKQKKSNNFDESILNDNSNSKIDENTKNNIVSSPKTKHGKKSKNKSKRSKEKDKKNHEEKGNKNNLNSKNKSEKKRRKKEEEEEKEKEIII